MLLAVDLAWITLPRVTRKLLLLIHCTVCCVIVVSLRAVNIFITPQGDWKLAGFYYARQVCN